MDVAAAVGAVLAAVFLGTLVRSAFGFGTAIVAVPLLALVIPVEVAVPLATLHSVTTAGVILARDWRSVRLGSAWRLVLPTLVGVPLGVLLLKAAGASAMKTALAVVIIAFSGYCLLGRRGVRLTTDRLAWAFGLAAGVLGGAFGMNGPPLVVYGLLRGWTPEEFRATLQGYFFPASLAGLCGYWAAGLWVPAVTWYYLLSLAPALVAIPLGRAVNRRMSGERFVRLVHVGLIGVGVLLLVQAV
jgi:uncharacterized membrane protein YfcA